jgi:predicted DNA-binding transcriptional regulator AlpA
MSNGTEEGFLDGKDVKELTKISASKRRALIAAGKFPAGVLIGPRTRVWPRSEVHAWVQEQIRVARESGDLEARAKLAATRMVEARHKKAANAETA